MPQTAMHVPDFAEQPLSCLSVGFRCDRRTAHCRRRQNGTGRRMPIRRMHARAPSPSARRSHPGALLISRGGGVMEPCANAPARPLPRLMRALRPTRSNSCLSITDAYDSKSRRVAQERRVHTHPPSLIPCPSPPIFHFSFFIFHFQTARLSSIVKPLFGIILGIFLPLLAMR